MYNSTVYRASDFGSLLMSPTVALP